MAGLICCYDTRQHFYLRVTHDEKLGKILGVVLTDDGAYDELADSQIAINDWKQIFLRAAVDGERLQFSASPDGKAWRNIGPVLDLEAFRRLRQHAAFHRRDDRRVRAGCRRHERRRGF